MAGDGPVYRIGKQKADRDLINVAGNLIFEQFEKKLPPLHQLPPDVADFTGRRDDLKKTTDFLQSVAEGSGTVPTILVISGMPGVGKSALAIHAAHNSKELFDEQLYVDLRGADEPGSKSLDPSDVLWSFLSSLGVYPGSIPEDIASRAGLFRSLLTEKGAIIFLDNAHDEKQVRPLLPGSRRCAVLITSRPALSALEGALPIKLDLMPYEEALDLLAKTAGDCRVRAEPDAAKRIVELCGRLPLAIRIAGGKLRDKEHWTLSKYADLLEDERKRLERLHLGDLDVRASFELSYRELCGIEARLFRLLSLLPGKDFEPGLAAAMLEIDEDSAPDAAESLVDLRLIEPSGEGRYRFHDLTRLFAREKAEIDETAKGKEAARLCAAQWYLKSSSVMKCLLIPETRHQFAQELVAQEGKDADKMVRGLFKLTLLWFEWEGANLFDSVRWSYEAGYWEGVYVLADNLVNFFQLRYLWAEWVETNKLALEAVRKAGNEEAEAQTLVNMGTVYGQQGRWDDAIKMFEDALKIYRDLGELHGRAQALVNMGSAYGKQGRWNDAIKMFEDAVKTCRDLEEKHGEGCALMGMGNVYHQQGQWDDSIKMYEASLKLFRDISDWHGVGNALMNIGIIKSHKARWDEAFDMYNSSLKVFRDLGDQQGEGLTLTNMGFTYLRKGLNKKAVSCWEEALQKLHPDSPDYKKLSGWLQSFAES